MPAAALCKLRIVRGSGYADRIRRYQIVINGARVGNIAHDSVLDLEVPSGPLTIEAEIDWCRSQPLAIEARPDKRIEIEVSNNFGSLMALWGITFGYRSYLALKRLPVV
jgi:hypothetical protein